MKLAQLYLVTSTLIGISTLSTPTTAIADTNIGEIIREGDRLDTENITQVKQLRDIAPSDWSYEALRNLRQKYGCIETVYGIGYRLRSESRSIRM